MTGLLLLVALAWSLPPTLYLMLRWEDDE